MQLNFKSCFFFFLKKASLTNCRHKQAPQGNECESCGLITQIGETRKDRFKKKNTLVDLSRPVVPTEGVDAHIYEFSKDGSVS